MKTKKMSVEEKSKRIDELLLEINKLCSDENGRAFEVLIIASIFELGSMGFSREESMVAVKIAVNEIYDDVEGVA